MIVDRRRIEQLSLQVPHPADVRRATGTITEALRVATLPGDGRPGRLFIRELELPPLRRGFVARRLAEWIGARIRQLGGRAVSLSDRRAADAPAVFVWDPVEPWLVALQRVATGRRLDEWFWPQLDAALATERSPAAVARVAWRALATGPAAVAAVPAAVGLLLEAGTLDPVVFEAVDPVLAAGLAAVVGSPRPEHPDVLAIPRRARAAAVAIGSCDSARGAAPPRVHGVDRGGGGSG